MIWRTWPGSRGRIELRPSEINLVALLHEQVAALRGETDAKGLQVQLTPATGVPRRVRGDADRLAQALSHLLRHSVRATRQGRISVEVRRHARDADLLRFVITDTCLSPITGTLAGMLEPFSRAVTDRARRHSDIGLTLAHGLATALGGQLSMRHSAGNGTTAVLTVRLPAVIDTPAARPASARTAPAAAPIDLPRPLASVLIADDNVSTRELLASMLDQDRFVVVGCANGREALHALEVARYDVVLMDLTMPQLDGWSALRVLRRQETERGLRRTAVIALGAAPLDTERQRCLDAGFDDHLVKPVRKSRLIDAIERATGREPGGRVGAAACTHTLRPVQHEALALLSGEGMIDVRSAVESLGGDTSLYLDAIEHLVPALGNFPTRFSDALGRRDFDRARQMARDMQSILDVVAAAPCASALGRMADALADPAAAIRHAEALADLERHLNPLIRSFQQAADVLRSARLAQPGPQQGQNSAL